MNDDGGAARVALVAACMAKGCTPEQTSLVFQELMGLTVVLDPREVQMQIESVIARVKEAT